MSRGFRKFTMVGSGLYVPESLKQPGELDNWPQCLQCHCAVEAVELCEMNGKYMEILARCTHRTGDKKNPKHYEAVRISWPRGRGPTDEEFRHLVRDLRFFGGTGAVSSQDADPVT